jgi:nicotinamide mononucleotide adenylyltransferase
MSAWIKVEDEMPDKDLPVIAWDGNEMHEAFWYSGLGERKVWTQNGTDYIEWKGVTHWIEMPYPPMTTCITNDKWVELLFKNKGNSENLQSESGCE